MEAGGPSVARDFLDREEVRGSNPLAFTVAASAFPLGDPRKGLGDVALLRSRPMLNHVRLVRSIGAAVVCATIVMVVPSAVAARPPKLPWDGPGIRTKPGRLIVTFEAGTSPAQRRRTHRDVGARLADQSRRTRVDVVELPPGVSALTAIRRYEAEPRVLSAPITIKSTARAFAWMSMISAGSPCCSTVRTTTPACSARLRSSAVRSSRWVAPTENA